MEIICFSAGVRQCNIAYSVVLVELLNFSIIFSQYCIAFVAAAVCVFMLPACLSANEK